MKKKVMSLLLAAALTVGLFSSVAFAAEEEKEEPVAEETFEEIVEENEEGLVVEDEDPVQANVEKTHVARIEVGMTTPVVGNKIRSLEANGVADVTAYDAQGNQIIYSFADYEFVKVASGNPVSEETVEWISDEEWYNEKIEKGVKYGAVFLWGEDDYYYCDDETVVVFNGDMPQIKFTDSEGLLITAYVMDALGDNLNDAPCYLDVPYTLTVEQGGTVAPKEQTFTLQLKNLNDFSVSLSGNTIKTNGVGTYKGVLRITLTKSDDLDALNRYLQSDEFGSSSLVWLPMPNSKWSRENNKGLEAYGLTFNWMERYPVYASSPAQTVGDGKNEWGGIYSIDFYPISECWVHGDFNGDVGDPQNEMSFVVKYTENTKKAAKNDTDKKYSSPATGDNSMSFTWIIVMAAAVVCGIGAVVLRKRQ